MARQSLSKTNSRILGQVVASFRNSFYIRTRDDQLLFVTNSQLGSPITINLTQGYNFEDLTPLNSDVKLFDDHLVVGEKAVIQLATAQPYKMTSIRAREVGVTHNTLRRLAFIIGILDTTLSVLDAKGIAYNESKRFIRNEALALRKINSHERFEREAFAILGLGSGFTPSGDDMLGGFLATWNTFAPWLGKAKILLSSEALTNRTSWISAKLFDQLQKQMLDSQLARLMEYAASGRQDEFVLASEGLLSRGHTSGLDLTTGIAISLSLIQDISTHASNTESLLNQLGF